VTPGLLISVINASSQITPIDAARGVLAIGKQLAEASQDHGLMPAIEYVPRGEVPNGLPCELADTIDVPGAAGYHDNGPNGPYIKILVDADWTVTLSHEALELGGDPSANIWADSADGNDYAYELCDADQGGVYEIDGVRVSNYVTPAFFDPFSGHGAKLDRMGRLTRPFETHEEGYQIMRTEPGRISQVFAAHGRLMHHLGGGVVVVFGHAFPEHKKQAKIAKAARRRGRWARGNFTMGG